MKKRIASFLAVVMLLLCLPLSASAQGAVDTSRDVRLSITNVYNKKPLDTEFTLYRISSIDENGQFTVLPKFAAYEDDLNIRGKNDAAWREVTEKIEADIIAEKILDLEPIKIKTNSSGIAVSTDLEQGLYIVMSSKTVVDKYTYSTIAFMVMLPCANPETNDWTYDVSVFAKPSMDKTPEDPKPSPKPSPEPSLPQTGQLVWPIPVLVFAGLFFIAVGLVLLKGKNNHEA